MLNRRTGLILGWIAVIALILLTKLHPPDGADRADFAQFLGRFHPLFVHLPIGFVLLVPVLELAGAAETRSYLRTAAGFVLPLAIVFALLAAFDGWLLAWSGGYKGPLVIQHMWGAVMLAIALMITGTLRPRRIAYGMGLMASLGLLFWAAHSGGGLSHGETFLTDEMPAGLKTVFHVATKPAPVQAPKPAAKTVYAAKIQPIFDHSCVSCHGPQKVKGDLRMDSYAGLMKGGKTGSAIEPWKPDDSELYRRITLPTDDDDFMPNNGKNLLSDADKALIKNWIAAGASDKQPLP